MSKSKNSKKTQYWMAYDHQTGEYYHSLVHPRKELCQKLRKQHVDKMYVDKKDGTCCWCGYVIGGHWLELFKVEPLRKKVCNG